MQSGEVRAHQQTAMGQICDLVSATLNGRHPQSGQVALERIAAATHPHARLFIGGGEPLRALPVPRPT